MRPLFKAGASWNLIRFCAENAAWLLFARNIPRHIQRYRVKALAHRLCLTAGIFAILTLAWIPIDLVSFDWPIARQFIAARLIIVLIFSLVFWASLRFQGYAALIACLGILVACPMAMHGMAYLIFGAEDLGFWGNINRDLYAGLPFVVMAGLCLFPLIVAESAVLAVFVIGLEVALSSTVGTFSWGSTISESWILGLLFGVAALSAMVQVFYFNSLLRRADNDPLTGAYTRRSGTEIATEAFETATLRDTPLTLLFLDLDRFKSINDGFGHDVGDHVLRNAVESLRGKIRDNDVLIRWGGEEFVILLPKTSLEEAQRVTDRIMHDWLGKRPDGPPVTASIGVSERQNDAAENLRGLVSIADQRMYQAKQNGRAQCVFADI